MAQYFFNRLDMLALPGQPVPHNGYGRPVDADFYSRAPGLIFESNRTATGTSMILLPVSAADVDLQLKARFLRNGTDNYYDTGLGFLFRYENINNYLCWNSSGKLANNTWGRAAKVVGYDRTNLHSPSTKTFVARALYQWFYMRVRLQGDQIQYKAWNEGSLPPSFGLAASIDLTGTASSGYVGFHVRSYGCMYDIEYMAVGTDGDNSPGSPLEKTVSGVIRDEGGNPCSRIVRAYHRPSGIILAETVSDETTGVYTLAVPLADEIDRVALAADGETLYNDLIDRVIPG